MNVEAVERSAFRSFGSCDYPFPNGSLEIDNAGFTTITAFEAFRDFTEEYCRLRLCNTGLPNRVSTYMTYNPLITICYNDPSYTSDFYAGNTAEELSEDRTYACVLKKVDPNSSKYKGVLLPENKIVKLSLFDYDAMMNMSVMCPVDREQSERFFTYLLNLQAPPMLLPVSPVMLMMLRPNPLKPYYSSSETICFLNAMCTDATTAVHRSRKNANSELPQILSDVERHARFVDYRKHNDMADTYARYHNNLNRIVADFEFLLSHCASFLEPESEQVKAKKAKQMDLLLLETYKIVYDYLISVINVLECACINAFFYDPVGDPEKAHVAMYSKGTVQYPWNDFSTRNPLKKFRNQQPILYENSTIGAIECESIINASKIAEMRNSAKKNFESMGEAYVIGEPALHEWEDFGHAQLIYVRSLFSEKMKEDHFSKAYETTLNQPYCREYIELLDAREHSGIKNAFRERPFFYFLLLKMTDHALENC
jgi:hypothetical protein